VTGAREWVLYPGGGRLPWAAAPDLRGRSYEIRAEVFADSGDEGVLLSQGDRLAGYALGVHGRRLWHDYVHAGVRTRTVAAAALPMGRWTSAGVAITAAGRGAVVRLRADGRDLASGWIPRLCRDRISCSPMDIGCDLGLTVGDYPAPARFTGRLRRIVVEAAGGQQVDDAAALGLEAALG
jgi:hypothetical protein